MRILATFVPILVLASAVGCNPESKRASEFAGGGGGDKKCCPAQAQSSCPPKEASSCCGSKDDAAGCAEGRKGAGCCKKENRSSGGCGDKSKSSTCEPKDKAPGCGEGGKKDSGCGSGQPQSKASGCGGGADATAVEVALESGDGLGKIEWMTNVAMALKVAAEEEKAVLLVFDADWCAPSRQMKRTTLADSRVAEIANRLFVRVLIDTDKNPEAADRYHVEEIPTTVVLAYDGTPVFRHEDAAGAAAYAALLEEADVACMQYRDLKRQADAEPDKVEPRLALARMLYRQGSFAAAAAEADRALTAAERSGCCASQEARAEIAVFAGECHAEARSDAEALDRIAAKLEDFDRSGEKGLRDNAMFFRAVASVVRDDPAEARSRLSRLISEYPGSDKAESAAIWMAWIELEKLENREGAAPMLRAFIDRYPESGYRPLAERLLREAEGRGK